MENLLAHGVELHFAHHGLFGLAADRQLDDIGVGGVDQRFERFGVYAERYGLAASVEDAGHLALAADGAAGFLAEVGARSCLDFESLHKFFVF